jgi:hypothetical protein
MNHDDGHFGESVAATYDDPDDAMFDPAVIEPTIGLELRERWAGWGRESFTSDSRSHVSVWEKGTR